MSPRPACMTEPEWADWQRPILGRKPTGHPCFDCPLEFHLAQRAVSACDGWPLHAGRRRLEYAPEHGLERRREQWRAYRKRKRARAAA